MNYLLDTTTLSDLLQQEPTTVARASRLFPTVDGVAVSVVTYGEVWYGLTIMPPGRRRQVREQRVRTVFVGLPLEDVTRVVADTYVQVKATLRRLGLPIPEADLWIATTALAGGYVLVSRDSHFVHVPGLTVEDWSQP